MGEGYRGTASLYLLTKIMWGFAGVSHLYVRATRSVGRIAMSRVTVILTHRDIRMSRKPLITNCPV